MADGTDFDPLAYSQSQVDGQATPAFDPLAYSQSASDAGKRGGKSYDVIDGKLVPTGSAEAKAAQSPTSGMSSADLAMAGAGKAQVDMYHGVRQLLGATGAQSDVDNAAARDKPLMATPAGVTGYVGGSLADAVIPAGLAGKAAQAAGLARTGAALTGLANPTTYAMGALSGAAQGALQPVETGDSRTLNTAGGAAMGAAGNAIARGVGAATGLAADKLGDSASRAVKALQDAGVPLDAAQRTGSMLWNRAKVMLGDHPLTAGAQADFADMQQKAVNKAFLSTTGETAANSATPDVMNRIRTRLGQTYDDIADRTSVDYNHIEGPLSDVLNNARLRLNDAQFGTIQRNVDDIVNKASQNGGMINGDQFKNVKMTLDKLSGGGDSDVGDVARDIRETMNNGLLQTAADKGNQADVDLLKKTNQQYRNMKTIEGAIDKQGSGDISPARMTSIMGQKANRSVSIYGQGDTSLSDLAKASNELITSHTPNSGTPARLMNLATLPAIGAIAGGVKEGDWKGVGEGAAAGIALPYIAQKALNARGLTGATNVLGSLGAKSSMPVAAGGAVQHLPLSAIFGLRDAAKADN